MNDFHDQIWAYLHNELPAEKRAQFEQAAEEDPSLKQEVDACKAVHQDLEAWGDQLLENELLAEWESEHPEYQEKRSRHGPMIRLAVPLAAAAALVLLLALPLHRGPINWERTVYGSAPQLRGESSGQPVYRRDDLKNAGRTLRKAVEEHLSEHTEFSEKWTLQIAFQEQKDGYLMVEVSGHSKRYPELKSVWEETIPGKERLSAELIVFAERIADDLTKRGKP
ncbi:MAG: hypothetical protein JXR40_08260 [Pontiellaceae bacterium]|nr:hypothetical protein [Pontiellaceae bacterium]